MTPDTQVDLAALHAAVRDAIAARFPELATVETYREDRTLPPLPACLIEMEDMEPSDDPDPGTGQIALAARWRARLILGFRTPEAALAVRRMAAALAHLVHLNRWGQPVAPARVGLVGPDDFEPDLDRYSVWSVEWEQVVHVGESIWGGEGTLPIEVLMGLAPAIGPENEGVYDPVVEP